MRRREAASKMKASGTPSNLGTHLSAKLRFNDARPAQPFFAGVSVGSVGEGGAAV